MNTSKVKKDNVVNLVHPPIPNIRIGMIGMGNRGVSTLKRYLDLDLKGIEFVAFSDLDSTNTDKAQEVLRNNNLPLAKTYSTPTGWKELCQQPNIDLVIICTDWLSHADIAIYAMEQEKHVAIEVPAATTVDDCWRIVETAERTRMHCTMLENCCYDPFALTVLNMVRKGILGDISHVEGAYIHDLRSQYFKEQDDGGFYNNWNQKYCMAHTGNPYPTHGLGPLCQVLNIHRTDKLISLVSMSSIQQGLPCYTERRFGTNSNEADQTYKLGDVNTTLIKTEKGRTIMLQYSISVPRPYSRLHSISGTKGFAQKYPIPCISIDPQGDQILSDNEMTALLKEHEHPFVTNIGNKAKKRGVKNTMNYMMDYRLIYCLQNGLPLDIDVYDAVEWSVIAELSEQSVLKGSQPVEIPDFLAEREK